MGESKIVNCPSCGKPGVVIPRPKDNLPINIGLTLFLPAEGYHLISHDDWRFCVVKDSA